MIDVADTDSCWPSFHLAYLDRLGLDPETSIPKIYGNLWCVSSYRTCGNIVLVLEYSYSLSNLSTVNPRISAGLWLALSSL